MALHPSLKTIFVHIPKNAGTSIRTILRKRGRELRTISEIKLSNHSNLLSYIQAVKYLNEDIEDYLTFTVVRNPWDRFVSAYEFARHPNISGGYFSAIDSRKPMHPDHQLLKDLTFEETLNTLDKNPKKLKNISFKSQFPFICDKNKNILVKKIFRYESLSTDEDFLKLFPDLPLLNSSQHKPFEQYYTTNSMINIISKVYETDIKMFNYKAPTLIQS